MATNRSDDFLLISLIPILRDTFKLIEKEVKKIHQNGNGAHGQRILTLSSSSREFSHDLRFCEDTTFAHHLKASTYSELLSFIYHIQRIYLSLACNVNTVHITNIDLVIVLSYIVPSAVLTINGSSCCYKPTSSKSDFIKKIMIKTIRGALAFRETEIIVNRDESMKFVFKLSYFLAFVLNFEGAAAMIYILTTLIQMKLKLGWKIAMTISGAGNAYLHESQFWKLTKRIVLPAS